MVKQRAQLAGYVILMTEKHADVEYEEVLTEGIETKNGLSLVCSDRGTVYPDKREVLKAIKRAEAFDFITGLHGYSYRAFPLYTPHARRDVK